MRLRHCIVPLLALVILACASREVLVPKSAVTPSGVDLSGQWQLRADADEQQRRINAAVRQTNGVDDSEILVPPPDEQMRTRPRRERGGLVHVFLENGRRIKITQTDGGLFISFDRAVVQEYRFGEQREVEIGPVVADRVSGWVGQEYVAETLDQNNMKLTERFALEKNGSVLRRTITLRSKNMEERTIVQTFDRAR